MLLSRLGGAAIFAPAIAPLFLHNRGLGFSLEPGHPAEYMPGRRLVVRLERDAPAGWARALRQRGYQVINEPPSDPVFGHAQVIQVTDDNLLAGAADPRAGDGAFVGCG